MDHLLGSGKAFNKIPTGALAAGSTFDSLQLADVVSESNSLHQVFSRHKLPGKQVLEHQAAL